jgi:hypothetical protein
VPGQPSSPGAPRTVRQAALLTGLEGVALLGLAVGLVVQTVAGSVAQAGNALAGAALSAGAGLLLGALARGLVRLRAWARSPVVVVQVVSIPVGVTLLQAGRPVFGVPVLVLAAAVLYLLFTPAARLALDRR